MLEVAGGILLALLVFCAFIALVKASVDRAYIRRIAARNVRERARRGIQEIDHPLQKPEPTGLHGLDKYLDERQEDEATEKRREQDRLARLKALWADIDSTVEQAVELVNSKLASHKMHVTLSPLDFFDEEHTVFGAVCTLHIEGQPSFALPYSGEMALALRDESGGVLYAGGCHVWRDGYRFQSSQISADKLADVITNTVKEVLDG